MDLRKQYLIQCIVTASNALRLNAHNIEVLALLRQSIASSEDLESDFIQMKKIMELAKLSARLLEIYNHLTKNRIDFTKLSIQFAEHSRSLVNDLGYLLERAVITKFAPALNQIQKNGKSDTIELDLTGRKDRSFTKDSFEEDGSTQQTGEKVQLSEILYEKSIPIEPSLPESEKLFSINNFETFEKIVLEQINLYQPLMQDIEAMRSNSEELLVFSKAMKELAEHSENYSITLLAKMLDTMSKGAFLLANKRIPEVKQVAESFRSCMIVAVTMIKQKQIDISVYVTKAERFAVGIEQYYGKELF